MGALQYVLAAPVVDRPAARQMYTTPVLTCPVLTGVVYICRAPVHIHARCWARLTTMSCGWVLSRQAVSAAVAGSPTTASARFTGTGPATGTDTKDPDAAGGDAAMREGSLGR